MQSGRGSTRARFSPARAGGVLCASSLRPHAACQTACGGSRAPAGRVTGRLSRLADRPSAQAAPANRAGRGKPGARPPTRPGAPTPRRVMSTTTTAATPEVRLVPLERDPRRRGREPAHAASTSRRSPSWPPRSASTACCSRSSSRTRRGRLHADRRRAALPRRQARRPHPGAGHAPRRRRAGDRAGRRREPAPPGPRPGRGSTRLPGDPQLSGRLNKKQLAERVSKSAAYVNERLRLLDLPEPIQEHVASGAIPVRLGQAADRDRQGQRAGRDRLRAARRQRASSRSTSWRSGRSG